MENILEKVSNLVKVKKITNLIKDIRKRPNIKNNKTVLAISYLAYWLYIINESELALEVSSLIDNINFENDYLIWEPVQSVLILESLIYTERVELDKLEELSISIRVAESSGDESTIEKNKRILKRVLDGSLLYDGFIKEDQEKHDIKYEIQHRFLQFKLLCYMREMGGSAKYTVEYLANEMQKEKIFLCNNINLAK